MAEEDPRFLITPRGNTLRADDDGVEEEYLVEGAVFGTTQDTGMEEMMAIKAALPGDAVRTWDGEDYRKKSTVEVLCDAEKNELVVARVRYERIGTSAGPSSEWRMSLSSGLMTVNVRMALEKQKVTYFFNDTADQPNVGLAIGVAGGVQSKTVTGADVPFPQLTLSLDRTISMSDWDRLAEMITEKSGMINNDTVRLGRLTFQPNEVLFYGGEVSYGTGGLPTARLSFGVKRRGKITVTGGPGDSISREIETPGWWFPWSFERPQTGDADEVDGMETVLVAQARVHQETAFSGLII